MTTFRLVCATSFALALLTACSADFKSGAIKCAPQEPRCPEGFECSNGEQCFVKGERPATTDAGGLGNPGTGGTIPILGGTGGATGNGGAGGMMSGNGGAGGTTPTVPGVDGGMGLDGPMGMGGAMGTAGMGGGSCPAGKMECPAMGDIPAGCADVGTTCSTATRCGTQLYVCAKPTELVQCDQNGKCEELAAVCDPAKIDTTNPSANCTKCGFRKCCAAFAKCAAVQCVNNQTSPEFIALANCLGTYCNAECR